MADFKGSSRKGVLHLYSSQPLTAFEHTPVDHPSLTTSAPQNLLLFIDGLFGGFSNVPYTTSISHALPPSWTIAEVHLSSSYLGWGASSLKKDVLEISKCVSYFRAFKTGKIVLMGHSTGCQDVMEYLTGEGHETREQIEGGILQAPVSDREAMVFFGADDHLASITAKAKQMIDAGEGEDILSSKDMKGTFAPVPVSARRWLSIASPNHDGDDDYFSSDLTDERLLTSFGTLPARSPLLILASGADEYVPKSIDKEALVKRWIEIVKRGEGKVDEEHSGILEGASHNVSKNPEEVVDELVKRVLGFLGGLSAQSHL